MKKGGGARQNFVRLGKKGATLRKWAGQKGKWGVCVVDSVCVCVWIPALCCAKKKKDWVGLFGNSGTGKTPGLSLGKETQRGDKVGRKAGILGTCEGWLDCAIGG